MQQNLSGKTSQKSQTIDKIVVEIITVTLTLLIKTNFYALYYHKRQISLGCVKASIDAIFGSSVLLNMMHSMYGIKILQ